MLHWRRLPLRLAATLAAGLPRDSRSMQRLAGQKAPESLLLQAAVVDSLHGIEWQLAGCPGGRPPASVLAALNGRQEDGGEVRAYDSPEDFEAACAALRGGEAFAD